ncbi:hypothetical protein [Desulfosporosinus sp. Sb-LF]|uniref:hypothetical protein n=1 Tax=Desulfosporosinus sp. Sb-LF TaxID=2560027 RepID=UPI0013050818|nr:hypothetical protein [Desulfosporosinus sp. Sb-LF]
MEEMGIFQYTKVSTVYFGETLEASAEAAYPERKTSWRRLDFRTRTGGTPTP